MIKKIQTPLTSEAIADLKVGDIVALSGKILVARDAAHEKMVTSLKRNEELSFSIKDETIFYAGPAPTPPGAVIGSIGPTSSYRMDPYTPFLLSSGVHGMIGKGIRSKEVVEAIKEHKAVYFGATGGASVLLSSFVISAETVAYEELGPEAVLRLEVKDMPLVVLIDSCGRNLYDKQNS